MRGFPIFEAVQPSPLLNCATNYKDSKARCHTLLTSDAEISSYYEAFEGIVVRDQDFKLSPLG